MSAMRRPNEEGLRLGEFLEKWNSTITNYLVTAEDMQRPKLMFLIEAIFEVFDALGLDGDDVIQTPIEDIEENVAESFGVLAPILNLTEAVNTLLDKIYVEFPKITPFDLLTPNHLVTLSLLKFLLNYLVFALDRDQDAREHERGVLLMVEEREQLLAEKDKLEDELHEIQMEEANREQRMHHLEEKIERLKIEPIEHQEKIEELDKQLKIAQDENRQLLAILVSQQDKHSELQIQINRLCEYVVPENEQQEVLRAREQALQQEEEVKAANEEASNSLWGREASIKTLRANLVHITECQIQLDTVKQLLDKISEVEKSNNPDSSGEAELRRLRADCSEALQRTEEQKAAHRAWQEDAHKAGQEAGRELQACLSDEQKCKLQYEQCLEEVGASRRRVLDYRAATLKYNREKEQFFVRYTQEIPKEYDDLIEKMVQRAKDVLNKTRKKCDNK